jgi:hypothetical protein
MKPLNATDQAIKFLFHFSNQQVETLLLNFWMIFYPIQSSNLGESGVLGGKKVKKIFDISQ